MRHSWASEQGAVVVDGENAGLPPISVALNGSPAALPPALNSRALMLASKVSVPPSQPITNAPLGRMPAAGRPLPELPPIAPEKARKTSPSGSPSAAKRRAGTSRVVSNVKRRSQVMTKRPSGVIASDGSARSKASSVLTSRSSKRGCPSAA